MNILKKTLFIIVVALIIIILVSVKYESPKKIERVYKNCNITINDRVILNNTVTLTGVIRRDLRGAMGILNSVISINIEDIEDLSQLEFDMILTLISKGVYKGHVYNEKLFGDVVLSEELECLRIDIKTIN